MLFSFKQFCLAGMYGCNVITGVLAFSDAFSLSSLYLTAVSYFNKRLIYC